MRLLRFCIAASLFVSVSFFAASWLPLPVVKGRIESLVPGHSLALTAERFSSVREGCLVTAALFLFVAIILFGYRRRLPVKYQDLINHRHLCLEDWKQAILSHVTDPWTVWPFFIVFCVGFVLRVAQLSRPIRLDEAFAYFSYWAHPLYWGLSDYSSSNSHLFYALLVYVSRHLFGDSLTSLRLPALAGGLLMMPATYAVAAALYNRRAALVATAFVASGPPFIDFSAKARGYTWQCLFLLLTSLFACRIAKDEANEFDWVGLVLASALAIYTIPTSVIPLGIIAIWLVLMSLQTGGLKKLICLLKQLIPASMAVLVLIMLLYFPPILVSGPRAIFANRFIVPLSRSEFRVLGPAMARTTWVRWNDGVPVAARVLIYAGFVLGLVAHHRIARHAVGLVPLLIVLCGAVMATSRQAIYPRVWMFVWLFSLITAGAGLALALQRRWLTAVCAVITVVAVGSAAQNDKVFLWSATETGNIQGLEEVGLWLSQNLGQGDRIVASPLAGPTLDYLLRQRWPKLEPQIECTTSGLPMCGRRAVLSGPEPGRILAVVAKQPAVEDGHSKNPALWNRPEMHPSVIMFKEHDRKQYSEPKIVMDIIGATIWESRNLLASPSGAR